SAAKGVRRHGVDPNRSRNEEDMLFIASLFSPVSSFSLLPQQPSRDLPPFPTSHRPPRLELISETGAKRTSTRRPTFPDPPPPLLLVRIGRNLPWKPTVRPNATRTSSSNISLISSPNLSSEAPGARQDFKRRPLRDQSSSDHLGDSAEFSAEV
ncbi:hypothetical protein Prudu_018831, partial [Prunus dulcis]